MSLFDKSKSKNPFKGSKIGPESKLSDFLDSDEVELIEQKTNYLISQLRGNFSEKHIDINKESIGLALQEIYTIAYIKGLNSKQ